MRASVRVTYHEAQVRFSEQRDVVLLVANSDNQGWYTIQSGIVPQRTKRSTFSGSGREREPASTAAQLQSLSRREVM